MRMPAMRIAAAISAAVAVAAATVSAEVFLRRPAGTGAASRQWPHDVPVWTQSPPAFSLTMKNGTSVVSANSRLPPAAALDEACAAYRAQGWKELAVCASDMRLFAKGGTVAAVQTQPAAGGSCIVAIQRRR